MATHCPPWRQQHRLLLVLVLVWVGAPPGGVWGFNVDLEQASLYTGGTEDTSTNRPQRDTMFGYSLDQHVTHTGDYR